MRIATTLLVFCVSALAVLGLVMITSASIGMKSSSYLPNQTLWCGIGLVVFGIAAGPDYRWLRRASWWLLAFSAVLLICVFVPNVGKMVNGAHRWIAYKSISFQPSELAKLALIIALARYCELSQAHMRTFFRGVFVPGLMVGVMLALIVIEPDWGTTLLLATVCGVMLLVAGMRPVYFWGAVVVASITLVVAINHDDVRSDRVMAWLHPELYKQSKGYQAYQAMIALGSGGLTGVGLGEGRSKLGFVPEHHTDFILSVIGEELGLVATLAVLAAFITIVICGTYIAWNARDTFGMLMATGLTFLFGLQAFINIGVVTSALPNKGLALPFLSYGGSSVLAMSAAAGLLLNVARRSRASGQRTSLAGSDLNPFSEATA